MDKAVYLKSLNLDQLKREASGTIDELQQNKQVLRELKQWLRKASDKVDLIKADLRRSEDYNNSGKNAENREAWLLRQKVDCQVYEDAIREMENLQERVDTVMIETDKMKDDFAFYLAEMNLDAAELRFMAGEV
jgi:hypothetical protein